MYFVKTDFQSMAIIIALKVLEKLEIGLVVDILGNFSFLSVFKFHFVSPVVKYGHN